MHYIVFDLEATCWQGYQPGWRQEVIEIGAFKLNRFGEVLDSFHSMVRPTERPSLSSYCTELTGIQQSEVGNAPLFPDVHEAMTEWIGEETCILCAWGAKDKTILEGECNFHRLETSWLEEYSDLKRQYHQLKQLKHKQGLVKTLDKEGIPFEGTAHRAMADAENLCRLFIRYIDEWQF